MLECVLNRIFSQNIEQDSLSELERVGASSYLRDHKNINQVRKGAFEKQNKVKLGRKDFIHSCNFVNGMTVHSWDSICIYVHNSEQIGGAIEKKGNKLSTGKKF